MDQKLKNASIVNAESKSVLGQLELAHVRIGGN